MERLRKYNTNKKRQVKKCSWGVPANKHEPQTELSAAYIRRREDLLISCTAVRQYVQGSIPGKPLPGKYFKV